MKNLSLGAHASFLVLIFSMLLTTSRSLRVTHHPCKSSSVPSVLYCIYFSLFVFSVYSLNLFSTLLMLLEKHVVLFLLLLFHYSHFMVDISVSLGEEGSTFGDQGHLSPKVGVFSIVNGLVVIHIYNL